MGWMRRRSGPHGGAFGHPVRRWAVGLGAALHELHGEFRIGIETTRTHAHGKPEATSKIDAQRDALIQNVARTPRHPCALRRALPHRVEGNECRRHWGWAGAKVPTSDCAHACGTCCVRARSQD